MTEAPYQAQDHSLMTSALSVSKKGQSKWA